MENTIVITIFGIIFIGLIILNTYISLHLNNKETASNKKKKPILYKNWSSLDTIFLNYLLWLFVFSAIFKDENGNSYILNIPTALIGIVGILIGIYMIISLIRNIVYLTLQSISYIKKKTSSKNDSHKKKK